MGIVKVKGYKPKILDMELAIAKYFNYRQNIIVPNISWGMELHECDLLVMTKAGYAKEIEIKTSKADLIKDLKKSHGHRSDKIKQLYFAIPKHLEPHIEYIPKRAGILIVDETDRGYVHVQEIREAKINNRYKFSSEQILKVATLGNLRTWNLRTKLQKALVN